MSVAVKIPLTADWGCIPLVRCRVTRADSPFTIPVDISLGLVGNSSAFDNVLYWLAVQQLLTSEF